MLTMVGPRSRTTRPDAFAGAPPGTWWRPLIGAAAASLAASAAALAAPAWQAETRIGAPDYWAWVLTGLQVMALWAAGTRRWWGWLLGAGVQPVWITYAILTAQIGFIPGCALSGVVQGYNYKRGAAIRSRQLARQPTHGAQR